MSDNSVPYSIRCLFQNGTSIACTVDEDSKISDLISKLEQTPDVKVPSGFQTSIIYRGKFLDRNEKISSIETMKEFSVQVYFRGNKQQQQPTDDAREIKGFDRLSRMNYTPEQIRLIRTNFHLMNGSTGLSQEERIDLEEEWFPVIFNQDNPIDILNVNLNGNGDAGINNQEETLDGNNDDAFNDLPSWVHLLVGFGLGSVFGFVAIIIVFIGIRNRFLLIGIVLGILMHFTLASNNSFL